MKRPFLSLLLCLIATASFAQQLTNRIPYFKNGKYGVCDSTKKIIIQPMYDDVKMSDSLGFIALKQGSLWGIWDQNGNMIFAPAYETIDLNEYYDYFDVSIKGKYGAVSLDGKTVIPCKYSDISAGAGAALVVRKKNKYGIISIQNGKTILPVKSKDYPSTYSYTMIQTSKNGYVGVMNTSGVQIVPAKYEYVQVDNGFILAATKTGPFYDLYDTLGHLIIGRQTYMSIQCTRDSYVSLETDEGYSVYNSGGRKVFPLADSSAVDGYALCDRDSSPYVIITKSYNPYAYDESDYYYDYSYYKYGIADWSGRVVLPAVYNDITTTYIGGKKYFDLRTDSAEILKDMQLHDFLTISDDSMYGVSEYHKDLMIVQKNYLYGAMDYHQHIIIPIKYTSLRYDDKYDRFYYQKHLGWGIMDGKGKPITRPIYSAIDDYSDSIAIVHDIYGEFSNLIDLKGKLLLKDSACEELSQVYPFDDENYDGGYYGDEYYGDGYDEGYYQSDYSEDTLSPKHLRYYSFSKNEKYGVVNSKGKIIIPDTCVSLYAFGHGGLFEIENSTHDRFYVCDSTGKHLSKAYAYMSNADKYGLITVSSKVYHEDQYMVDINGNEFVVPTTDTLQYGYIDSKGKEIVPPIYMSENSNNQYDEYGYTIQATDSILFMQRLDTTIDVYDLSSGLLKGISGKYKYLESYDHKHPLFIVHAETGGKIGLLDANGKEILPMNFFYLYPFETDSNFIVAEDTAYVYHYYDMQGRPAKFDVDYPNANFSPSYPGEMMVTYNGKNGVITTDGKVLVPVEYEGIIGIREGLYAVSKDGKYGVVTNHNKQIIAPEFAYIDGFFRGNLLMVYPTASDRDNGTARLMNLNGTRYWE